MFASSRSRRHAIGGGLVGLLSLLGVGQDDDGALAERRRRKRDKQRCPKARRCGGDCCKRSMECCDGKCRDKCGQGRRRNKRTCECERCLKEGQAGDGPACAADAECCSGVCGRIRTGFKTCRERACRRPGGTCTSTVECCEGFCARNPRDPAGLLRCTCVGGREFCGGEWLPLCPLGFLRDPETCECTCLPVGERCPFDASGGFDEACCSGQCGCPPASFGLCTCRKATCGAENAPCVSDDDCCEGTCEGAGVLKTCRTSV